LRGIDEQIAKAQRAVDGTAAVKRNRYIKQSGATKVSGEFGLDAHHQLWRIEKGFRMSEHELQARPIYHHKRESIEAHLSIVFAALAVSRWIEYQTGWNIKKFVQSTHRYRTVQIRAELTRPSPRSARPAAVRTNLT
jgi:transposase